MLPLTPTSTLIARQLLYNAALEHGSARVYPTAVMYTDVETDCVDDVETACVDGKSATYVLLFTRTEGCTRTGLKSCSY